jgi:LruC domain-containing protein
MSVNEIANIIGRHDVPTWVMQKVNTYLPEKKIINPKYLADVYDPNLHIEENSEVEVTFVHEGAGYKNTLGYFIYDFDSQGKINIQSRGLVFPNASYDPKAEEAQSSSYAGLKEGGGKLFKGDYTYLMDSEGRKITFSAGTHIGFFLVPDGYNEGTVDSWDENNPNLPFDNPEQNSSIRDKGIVTTLDFLNPEKVRDKGKHEQDSRHFTTFGVKNDSKDFLNGEDFLLLCMEDIIRPQGDQDFNDCIFIVRAKGIDICKHPESGCEGDCIYRSIPEKTDGLICFDDTYQFPGVYDINRDSDMNDFVSYYRFTELNCQDDIKKIMGTFHFMHRGAWYDHDFGIHIPYINSFQGIVKGELFFSDGNHETFQYSLSDVQNNRILIFQSTKRFLPIPQGGEGFTNTRPQDPFVNPSSARFVIEFDTPVKRTDIGNMQMPYDPYLLVYTSGSSDGVNWSYDLHLNGMNRFLDAPSGLPEEMGEDSFRRIKNGMPYCFITNKSFPIVLERENIAEAYPRYTNWEPPFDPDKAEEVWMNEKKTYKLLKKMIIKPERNWTISI